MVGKLLFAIALCLFGYSLFEPSVSIVGQRALSGLETFYYTLRYATAGLFSPGSFSDIVSNLLALISAAANFVFVFWAMLLFVPSVVPAMRWFWWMSLLFLLAAAYTGLQAHLSARVELLQGYFFWLGSLCMMFLAPVVWRAERAIKKQLKRKPRSGTDSQLCCSGAGR